MTDFNEYIDIKCQEARDNAHTIIPEHKETRITNGNETRIWIEQSENAQGSYWQLFFVRSNCPCGNCKKALIASPKVSGKPHPDMVADMTRIVLVEDNSRNHNSPLKGLFDFLSSAVEDGSAEIIDAKEVFRKTGQTEH